MTKRKNNKGKPLYNSGAAVLKKKNRSSNYIPAVKNVSDKVFAGNAIRSRDEYFYGGKPKPEYNDKPAVMYRKAYVIETNNLDELAVVKSTTSKGHTLVTKPDQKFKANVYIIDNDGNPIKISPKGAAKPKFIRSSTDDLTAADVEKIRKRTYKFADSNEKIVELKSRSRNNPNGKNKR